MQFVIVLPYHRYNHAAIVLRDLSCVAEELQDLRGSLYVAVVSLVVTVLVMVKQRR